MRINNISNQSFTSVIKVTSDTNTNGKKVDKRTREIFSTLDGDKGSVYDKDTSDKIRKFFYSNISDLTPRTKTCLKKINGDIYLFTGADEQRAQKANKVFSKKVNKLTKEFKTIIKSDAHCDFYGLKDDYDKLIKNLHNERDQRLLNMVEDGKNGKPKTEINIAADQNGEPLFIEYSSIRSKNGNADISYNLLFV